MILKTQPTKPLSSWPPSGYYRTRKVRDGDSWISLGKDYGRTDPWDIILFNFETKIPEEVNHYMETLLGTTRSNDGKNYSFSAADSPGTVYIPPSGWRPAFGPYPNYKKDVIRHLSDPRVSRVPFLNQEAVLKIVNEIIQVPAVSFLPVPFEYNYGNILFRRSYGASGMGGWLWVVKEAVHIVEGPLGWGAQPLGVEPTHFSVDAEVKSWVALAAFMDISLPPALHMFDLIQFKAGKQQKLLIYEAARQYWLEKKKGKLYGPSLDPVRKLVVNDPDCARRIRGPWKPNEADY